MEEIKLYLYHKISPLGLNYLGVTHQDPYIYMGSGVYWKRHLKSHNFISEDIKTIILFETTDEKELIEKSTYYSEVYDIVNSKKWANLIPETGNNSVLGMKHSEETKKKLSKIHKGRFVGDKNPMFGKPVSDNTINKIREANKGHKHSEETKNKIREKLIGNKHTLGHKHSKELRERMAKSNIGKHNIPKSEEEKRKMSERGKGRGNNNYNPTSILQYDINNNFVNEWQDLLSLIESGYTRRQVKEISRSCRNIIKTYYGYIWKYKE
jgi:NUMOD3 motif